MGLILEICVDSAAGLAQAVAGGADRIELCSALVLGGLTPSTGFMAQAAHCGVPVMAMIRPRDGDFCFDDSEALAMERDIAAARQAGLAGVVLGASLPDGRLDVDLLAHLAAQARGMDLTLHRCFDLCPDRAQALEQAIALGFRRILTSGGAVSAMAGRTELARLSSQAAGRIGIMPGAGIGPETAPMLAALGFAELHGSCAEDAPHSGPAVALGFAPAMARRTSAARIRALRAALD
ncbi:copper homeostasis protein CutC [Neotabrizicola sp. sgz301269]|uniref:copper homeostasis protein CutC n=1 Tax=Neotabrizicola sp. sgz301269 TaxID=3276282 RepID=UPI00376FB7A9